mgnify:CR=1 FL=1
MSTAHAHRIDVRAGAEREVTVDQIVGEMSRLWGDISAEVEQETGQIPLRTSILTLIIIASGESEIRMAHETLHELIEQLPSRVIVVEIHPAGSPFDASVSGHCRLHGTGRTACYEVIEIHTPPERLSAVPSMIAPLELYDVPSFMWWVGQVDFSSPEFRRLTPVVDRVIIDTARFDSARDAFSGFERFLYEGESGCTGTDLAWARVTRWREAIAQAFDHPETIGLLHAIESVDLSYDPSAEAQALLILGWLASRLDWNLASADADGTSLTFQAQSAAGGDIDIRLHRQASTGVGVRSVRILARQGEHNARISIRGRAQNLVVTSVEWAGIPRQDRVDRLPRLHLSDLIGQELLVQSHDEHYHQALSTVVSAVSLLGSAHDQKS